MQYFLPHNFHRPTSLISRASDKKKINYHKYF